MAVDVLINNSDRMPLLWDNDGNTENLMLINAVRDEHGGTTHCVPVAIDTMVSCFDHTASKISAASFASLCARVTGLADQLAAEPSVEAARSCEPCQRFRRLLLHGRGTVEDEAYCPPVGHDIGDEGVAEVMAGLREGFSELRRVVTKAWLVDCHNRLRSLTQGDPFALQSDAAQRGDCGFGSISVEFMCRLAECFDGSAAAGSTAEGSAATQPG